VSVAQNANRNHASKLSAPLAGLWLPGVEADLDLHVFHTPARKAGPKPGTAQWLQWEGNRNADAVSRHRAAQTRAPDVVADWLAWHVRFIESARAACASCHHPFRPASGLQYGQKSQFTHLDPAGRAAHLRSVWAPAASRFRPRFALCCGRDLGAPTRARSASAARARFSWRRLAPGVVHASADSAFACARCTDS
jgi:hypothetical protein